MTTMTRLLSAGRRCASWTTIRFASTAVQNVRILYGSQGGTAQMFGMQLQDALLSHQPDSNVTLMGLHEVKDQAIEHANGGNRSQTMDDQAVHIFLISVAGVGEPPDNARAFYEYIMSTDDSHRHLHYTVFGLGNQKAHPNHYNIIGKRLDSRLEELGANRVFPLGLGDDGECIEDDFDVWMEALVTKLSQTDYVVEEEGVVKEGDSAATEPVTSNLNVTTSPMICRRLSTKYPTLTLEPPASDTVREDLFHLPQHSSFYAPDVRRLPVVDNRLLSARSLEYGLRELTLSLPEDVTYEAGDHMVLYPRNSNCIVEAFLQVLDVQPHAVIAGASAAVRDGANSDSSRAYPFPTGITVMETLSHCVDLGALPTPAFARTILDRSDISYKDDIANPRRTVLDLTLEAKTELSLEDWLFSLPPMQPRYYSIASSPLRHPHKVLLTYRPVKYVTSLGILREGVCTSYMSNLGVHETSPAFVTAAIRSNPTFRLPKDPSAPVLLIAGGCGIAPIRSFLEERLSLYNRNEIASFGESHLFLGFRSPSDEVYQSMVGEALEKGVVSEAHVSYTSGCMTAEQNCRLVSDTLRANGRLVWDLFQRGGYAFLCGGARTFGAAIEREVLEIFRENGNMTLDDATKYLQSLIKEGRFCEDLAD